MPSAEVIAKARRELHKRIDDLEGEEAVNMSRSWPKFKKWVGKVLRRIGIFIDDIFDAIGASLEALWKGLKRACGY